MILDCVSEAERYMGAGLPSGMAVALKHLAATDLTGLSLGKHELEDGVFVSMQSYETKKASKIVWETHRRYIDIQVVVKGRERLLWAGLSEGLTVTKPYDEKIDAELYERGDDGSGVLLEPGRFAVFFPADAHAPCLQAGDVAEPVLKAVYKVPV